MKFKRSVIATAAAVTVALGAAPFAPANAADLTAEQVAGDTPVGIVKEWEGDKHPRLMPGTDKPEAWFEKVDHKTLYSFLVYSPSMDRDIPIAVVPATNEQGQYVDNAPTIYLLNGAGSSAQNGDWVSQFDVEDFFKGKSVNVVIPQDGAFSYYTDWVDQDPHSVYVNGPQKWETFLTKELPGPIEKTMKANNQRAIVGFSMSGTTSLVLPAKYPGFYDSAASFSGCAATSSFHGYNFARLTVDRASKATPEQIWGPMGGEYNRANDALVLADQLRGTDLYVSAATGLAGRSDQVSDIVGRYGVSPLAASVNAAILQGEGGVIEAAINKCTHDLKAKLDGLGIPAHFEFRNAGTHSWPYWRDDIQQAWDTTIAPSFGR